MDWDLPLKRAWDLRQAAGETGELVLSEMNLLNYGGITEDYQRRKAEFIQYVYEHLREWSVASMCIHAMQSGWNHADLIEGGKSNLAWEMYRKLAGGA